MSCQTLPTDNATSLVNRRDAMELNWTDYHYLGHCLQGFFFGKISVTCQAQIAKAVQYRPIPGLYSGIFAIYLQYRESQKGSYEAKNIIFYALCMLYALSAVTSIIGILHSSHSWPDAVSIDNHGCLNFLYRTSR